MLTKFSQLLVFSICIFFTLSCKTSEEKKFKKLVVVMNGDIDARKLAVFLGDRDAIAPKNGVGLSTQIQQDSNSSKITIILDGDQNPDEVIKSANELIKQFKLEKQLVEISIKN